MTRCQVPNRHLVVEGRRDPRLQVAAAGTGTKFFLLIDGIDGGQLQVRRN
jgi:hypothetical protein